MFWAVAAFITVGLFYVIAVGLMHR